MENDEFYIENSFGKYFLNLCGHYQLVSSKEEASCWKDVSDKSMWMLLEEIRESTGRDFNVRAKNGALVEEPEEARTFEIQKSFTIENVAKVVTVEPTFFKPTKDSCKEILNTYISEIVITGKAQYIGIVETKQQKYYRISQTADSLTQIKEVLVNFLHV